MNESRGKPLPAHAGSDAGTPVISVIMPNYNGGQFLLRAIESVLRQSFDRLELILVDDGSDDDSLAIARTVEDARVRVIEQNHEGVCAARNRGIREARGACIAFLDSDDTWAPDCLERLHDALSRTPDGALAYCGWQNVGLAGERGKPYIPSEYEIPEKMELWLQNCRWPIHAALTRTTAIRGVGGFNPQFPTSEDFLLWLQIVARHRIVRVPEVLAFYFHHKGPRATANLLRMAVNHLGAQEHFLKQNPALRRALGTRKIRELTVGEMLRRGYQCYWGDDLQSARAIFRRVMKRGYGTATDWKRMLPALLPWRMHRWLVGRHSPGRPENPHHHASR